MKSFGQQQGVCNKANLIKYLNPSTLMQTKSHRTRSQLSSNIHCRSMQDLQLHLSVPSQQSKQNPKPSIHHSSLYTDKQNINKNQQPENKSRSLSKFITFFENSSLMGQVKKEVNDNRRKNNYNGFCYDLKLTGNSTVGGCNGGSSSNRNNINNGNNQKRIMRKKEKQNMSYQTVTPSTHPRQLTNTSQTRSPPILSSKHAPTTTNNNLSQQIEQILKLRQTLQNYKQRQTIYNEKISQLNQREQQLCECIEQLQREKEQRDKKVGEYEARIRQLEVRNKQTIDKQKMQKSGRRESREQAMVIKSLKKVINQQLTKIIELERVKIENQYLREKLGKGNDESFSESGFSNNQGDYSFQYDHRRGKGESGSSTVRSSVDCEFGVDVFKKTKPLKNQLTKGNEKEIHHHSSNRHFKSFFQVEQSPVSSLDGNIMNLFKPYQSRKKSGQSKDEPAKQQNVMIKISQPESSFTREAIEEVNEENYDNEVSARKGHSRDNNSHSFDDDQQEEEDSLRQEGDSILEEVDEYLTKWRNRQ